MQLDSKAEYLLHAGFANTLSELGNILRVKGLAVLEILFAGEVLPIGVLHSTIQHRLVTLIEHALEQEHPQHSADGNAGPPSLAVKGSQFRLDPRPI